MHFTLLRNNSDHRDYSRARGFYLLDNVLEQNRWLFCQNRWIPAPACDSTSDHRYGLTSPDDLSLMNSSIPGSSYKLVQLASGDYSLHSLAYGETFHPVIGPVAEAEALYVNQLQLRERLKNHTGEFVIWDVGLGAAANALTVLRAAR